VSSSFAARLRGGLPTFLRGSPLSLARRIGQAP